MTVCCNAKECLYHHQGVCTQQDQLFTVQTIVDNRNEELTLWQCVDFDTLRTKARKGDF